MHLELSTHKVRNHIRTVRGFQVILDSDLAEFYQVTTKRLNEQVRRNPRRFPEDFAFQLNQDEFQVLKKTDSSSSERSPNQRRKYLPFVFTEQGVAMASAVLNSDRAIDVSITIMRTFVELRHIAETNEALSRRLDKLQKELDELKPRLKHPIGSHHNLGVPILSPRKAAHVETIQQVVIQIYHLKLRDLKSPSRAQSLVFPRQVAIYLVRKHTGLSFKEIAVHFGGKDHTTILHAYHKIRHALERGDESIQNAILSLEKALAQHSGVTADEET